MKIPTHTPRTELLVSPPRAWYFCLFTVSGFSGLIYESIWSHYLKLFLGHAAYAQSLVLAIFMGGMALGSWLASRHSHRWRRPILIYAGVEAIIGLAALVFHDLFQSVTELFYLTVLPQTESAALGSALKWTAAAGLIVPQSILLGMTFPLMSSGVLRRYPEARGASLAMLYFTNSIGAAVGVLASGFWLIELVGLPGTIFTSGVINLTLALIVWILVRLDPKAVCPPIAAEPRRASHEPRRVLLMLLVAAFVTGAASFIYEIAWIRMLSLVLGSSTHSFELMLSAFITGLAFGGLWIKTRIDSIGNVVRFAGVMQIAMGSVAALSLPLYGATFGWMSELLEVIPKTESGYDLYTFASHGIALAVMLPTTFIAGTTLPLFTHALMKQGGGEQSIGRIYAANTVGAIAGVVVATHLGMPLLGLEHLIGLGAALDVALGIYLLQRCEPRVGRAALASGAVAGLGVLALVLTLFELDPRQLASGVYRYGHREVEAGAEVLYYRDGKTASVGIIQYPNGYRSVVTNGKPDASIQMGADAPPTADEITMVMAGALPIAYKPDATLAANIGLGSGLTTHTLLADEAIERVDTVEIERFMADAAKHFGAKVSRAFDDPRSRIHVEDAKTFFSLSNHAYDLIIAEPSNPWVSGVSSLFSREFYAAIRNYLVEDGVFVQWLQLYEFNDALAFSVLKALSQHFPDYAIYNTDNVNLLIVARKTGALGAGDFDRVLRGRLGEDLSAVGLNRADDFLVRQTGTKRLVEALFGRFDVPANSDFYPFLDLNAPQARFQRTRAGLIESWGMAPLPILEMLSGVRLEAVSSNVAAPFPRLARIEAAEAIHAHLTREPSEGFEARVPAALRESLATLRRVGEACALEEETSGWLRAWHELAAATVPYLHRRKASELLDAVVSRECLARQSESTRRWMTFYEALAERDARNMVNVGAEVLAYEGEGLDAERYLYVLSAAMLGGIAVERQDVASQLWEHYGANVFAGRPIPAFADLLIQVSNAGRAQ